MKNGLFRKVMALTLIVVMAIGVATMSAGAATFGSGEVTATTELKSPVVTMGLPTSVKVTLDPYDTLGNGKTLSSNVFQIINKSNVPVQVMASSFGITGSGVQLVSTMTDAQLKETAAPEKLMVLNVQFADTVAPLPTGGVTTWGSVSKNLTAAASLDFGFGIDRASGGTATAPTPLLADEWTAFQLTGAIQPYATWATADLKFYVTFDYRGLTAADYTALIANLETGAHRLIKDANLPNNAVSKIIKVTAGGTDANVSTFSFKDGTLNLSTATFHKLATCLPASEIKTGAFVGNADGTVTISPSKDTTFIKAGGTKPVTVYAKVGDLVYSFAFFAYA